MGRIRFNISKDNLIILNLTVYSETHETSLTMNAGTKRPKIILFQAFRDLTGERINTPESLSAKEYSLDARRTKLWTISGSNQLSGTP